MQTSAASEHLVCAHESLVDRASVSLAQFMSYCAGWSVVPVDVAGKPVGALLINGPEIHACIVKEAHGLWMSRKVFRVIDQIIDSYGYASSRAQTEAGHKFLERMGFVEHDRDGFVIVYRKVKKYGH